VANGDLVLHRVSLNEDTQIVLLHGYFVLTY